MNTLFESKLDKKEKDLLRYYFGLDSNPETLIELIKDIDLEDNRNYLLLMAQICYERNKWDLVDKKIIERIKGFYRYHQLKNVILLKTLNKIVKNFNENNISCLLVKGGAMRLYFDKNVVRFMSDIDIFVTKSDFKKACKILTKLGAETKYYVMHSVSFQLDGADIDLHNYIFKFNEEKNSNILNRTIETNIYGNTVNVLSNLDMFIHLLVTQTYNFFINEYSKRHIKWLYDAYTVWNKLSDSEVNELPNRLKELHCSNSFYASFKLFEDYFPEIKERCLNVKPAEDYNEWLNKNYKLLEIMNKYDEKRFKYSKNTFSFKTILLHFEYLIEYRGYQYYRLNSDGRFRMLFPRYFIYAFGLNNFSTFKRKVLKRFRVKEGEKDG